MTLGTWIKVNYGSHQQLNDSLGLGKNTIGRWYNNDPKRFFMYLPKMSRDSSTQPVELLAMIEGRVEDVKALRGKHG